MTAPYLPKVATLEQAQSWLKHETGQDWPLARLIEETAITPWVWLDYSTEYPEVFSGRLEGYLARMLFAGDTQRLAAGATDVVLTMTELPDGRLVQLTGMRCPLSELRFMADDLRENATVANKPPAASSGAPESEEPPPPVATRPLPAQRFQEQEILRVIRQLGYDAKALPKPAKGKNGVKAEVRKIVPFNTPRIFDGAWERLRATGEIQDAS